MAWLVVQRAAASCFFFGASTEEFYSHLNRHLCGGTHMASTHTQIPGCCRVCQLLVPNCKTTKLLQYSRNPRAIWSRARDHCVRFSSQEHLDLDDVKHLDLTTESFDRQKILTHAQLCFAICLGKTIGAKNCTADFLDQNYLDKLD